jgi:hypothetical protein
MQKENIPRSYVTIIRLKTHALKIKTIPESYARHNAKLLEKIQGP